jgi:hypothetical protein
MEESSRGTFFRIPAAMPTYRDLACSHLIFPEGRYKMRSKTAPVLGASAPERIAEVRGGFVAHFQFHGLHPLAVLRYRRCQLFCPTRSSYHAVPGGQRRLGDVPPQSVSASRNQPDF